MTTLATFEGYEVEVASVAITRAGDGLSEALAVDPVELHIGDSVFVVLACEVSKVRFEPIKDTGGLRRVHTLATLTATTVDKALVDDVIRLQRDRIDHAKGVVALPFEEDG